MNHSRHPSVCGLTRGTSRRTPPLPMPRPMPLRHVPSVTNKRPEYIRIAFLIHTAWTASDQVQFLNTEQYTIFEWVFLMIDYPVISSTKPWDYTSTGEHRRKTDGRTDRKQRRLTLWVTHQFYARLKAFPLRGNINKALTPRRKKISCLLDFLFISVNHCLP